MLNNLIENIKTKIDEREKNSEEYENALKNSNIISNLLEIPNLERKDISPELLTKKNSNITEDKAKLIIDLLPINEMYLEILYGKEIRTKKEYFIVPTIYYLWIISKEGYNKYEYKSLKTEIIKKNILTKIINLSSYILEISNTEEEINNFINIINNEEYRNNIINTTIEKYGNSEIYKALNKINSGISYDKDYNIRFYTKDLFKKYNIKEINNYELLMDNNVMQEKKLKQNSRLTAAKNSCYEIKIRITPKDNNIFEIPILEKDTTSQIYQSTSDTYINNLNFAKKIIEVLDNINDELIYSKNTVE